MQVNIIVNSNNLQEEESTTLNNSTINFDNASGVNMGNVGVPDAGYLSIDTGNTNSTNSAIYANAIALSIIGVAILAAATIFMLIKKRHFKLKLILNRHKYAIYSLVALAMLVSIMSCFGLKNFNADNMTRGVDIANAQNINNDKNTLSITATNTELDITLENQPAYAYTKNTITVNSSTEAGYKLTAYIDGDTKDLVNTINNTGASKISGLSAVSSTQALIDNTWGIALEEPITKDSAVFYGLPTGAENSLTLINKDVATEEGDTIDVYTGAYIMPDLSPGIYSGVTIVYTAIANEMPITELTNGIYMQSINPAICANSPINQTYTLIDARDNTEYTVARLKDGNCWMTQNLELGFDNSGTTLSPSDSNIINNYTLFAANSVNKNNSKDGNYYNYEQATAGTNPEEGNSQYDICPANWRLPTHDEHESLISTYNFSGADASEYTSEPISLALSGYWDGDSIKRQGSCGYFWSSTARDESYAYYLRAFDSGYIYTSDQDKTRGHAIRCLVPEE